MFIPPASESSILGVLAMSSLCDATVTTGSRPALTPTTPSFSPAVAPVPVSSASSSARGPSRLVMTALIALFCVLWSSAFAAAKIALVDCPPLTLLTVRFLVAGALMVAVAWALAGRPRLTRRDLVSLAILGALNNAVYLGLSWTGLTTVTSAFAAVIISAGPLLVAAFAWPVLGERLTVVKVVGLLLGLAGVGLVLRSRLMGSAGIGGEDQLGTLLVVLGLLSLVAGTLAYKKLAPGGGLWVGNGLQCLFGGLMTLPAALLLDDWSSVRLTPGLIGGFLWLVLAVSVGCYALWFFLLGRSSATSASALQFLTPPLGLLFGWLILSEPVVPLDLLGIVPIAAGIWLVTRGWPRRAAVKPQA